MPNVMNNMNMMNNMNNMNMPNMMNNMNNMNMMNNMNIPNMMNNMNMPNMMNMMNNMNMPKSTGNIPKNNIGNINNVMMNNNDIQAKNMANTSKSSSFLQVKFKYFDMAKYPGGIDFMVQGRSDMTMQQLIRNFRTKLADDTVKIKDYKLNGMILDQNSTQTVGSFGIDENSIINATKL